MIASICVLILEILGSNVARAAECAPAVSVPVSEGRSGIQIDTSWSGTDVAFDALSHGEKVYFGYYNADRWLTVSELDRRTNMVCRVQLASRFDGWDSHNSVILALDATGRLQIAGNMHASPLVYGAEANTNDISSTALRPMVGQDESSVTYPAFIRDLDGRLFFLYRNGISGNGQWFANALSGSKWQRLLSTPLFASSWQGRPTSAYPSAFRFSRDGYIHLVVVWRRTPDVSTNYTISYIRSRDLVHWSDHNGHPVNLPLDPGNSDLIERTGEGHGLVNSARVTLMPSGSPLVTYTRYGADGRNVIVLASPDGARWRRMIIATAMRQTTMLGGGTIPTAPTFGDPYFDSSGTGTIVVVFPGEPQRRIHFDAKSLAVVGTALPLSKAVEARPLTIFPPVGLVSLRKLLRDVRVDGFGGNGKSVGSIVYFTQGINRDQKRQCTQQQPTACSPPPSPLIFVPSN